MTLKDEIALILNERDREIANLIATEANDYPSGSKERAAAFYMLDVFMRATGLRK